MFFNIKFSNQLRLIILNFRKTKLYSFKTMYKAKPIFSNPHVGNFTGANSHSGINYELVRLN